MTRLRSAIWPTLGVIAIIMIAFSLYVVTLFGQLKKAFLQQEQFVPTRLYSDVTRVTPAQPRGWIEDRLKSLGYTPQPSALSEPSTLSFTLHAVDYPTYLIPDDHPVMQSGGPPSGLKVVLHFDEPSEAKNQKEDHRRDALLHSIELEGREIPDLYLEPELVATLSQSGAAESKKQIRSLTQFADIPAPVWKAIIAVEDQHFLEHKGLDPRGLARALWVDIRTRSLAQGGSTITLQLVKNLMARKKKDFTKKVPEIFLAPMLELSFDKERILERYLNEVYLGQVGQLEIHGVAEGAEHFYGKKLDELNLAEIALMAGLIRGPGFYSPYHHKERAFERQRLVLKKMVETGQIAEAEAAAALKMPVRLSPPTRSLNKAPYFADFVKAELIRQVKDKVPENEIAEAGFRVYTTLDMAMNAAAQAAVAQGVATLEKRYKLDPITNPKERLEGALASVEPGTGFIRALVGGRSYGQSTFNRILNMKRQVGSTFKPFVYLAAYQKGLDAAGIPYGPGHPAEDGPWKLIFDHGRQEWSPKNYEKGHLGWINLRTALAHSINTVAARLGYEVGTERLIKTARALGIESELPAVPSLALGVAELSPVELLRAYAVLANHGIQDELTVIRAITEESGAAYAHFVYHPKEVLEAGPVDLLTDSLQSVFTEGTAKGAAAMGFDRPAAGKTGTTSNHRDAWFAGYTPQLTTVVWVGMDQTQPLEKNAKPSRVSLTGANAALPIWVDFMKDALRGDEPAPFPVSPHLVDVSIDRRTGQKSSMFCPGDQTVTEKYLKDGEPKDSTCASNWPESIRETKAD